MFLVGFFLGIVAIVGLEVLVVWFFIRKFIPKNRKVEEEIQATSKDVDHHQPLESASHKEGNVWVLEADKVPKAWLEKISREQERKKLFFEVHPVRKHVIIQDYLLILTESDGSNSLIPLNECSIEAVSATDQSKKKWAKKFPIRLESKSSAIYHGSKTLYIYLETSWEKESWCKALRYASGEEKAHSLASETQVEFKTYAMSLRDSYLSFLRPQAASRYEPISREKKMVDSLSKVRSLWKKLSRKFSKAGASRAHQDSDSNSSSGRANSTTNSPRASTEDNGSVHSPKSLPRSGSSGRYSTASDGDSEGRIVTDDGTVCWNLLISRLFFDIKSSQETIRFLQDRIQRTLSNMRIPNNIGEVICTNIYPGTLPPYIHSMTSLPVDKNDVWRFDIDLEYSGGLVLEIETRIDLCDIDTNQESNTDLLEGLEQIGKEFDHSEGTGDELEHKERELGDEGVKGTKSTTAAVPTPASPTSKSRWKSIVNSIARHVSQVPISMRISVASLRGTLRLHIKPPPSDQLWYGFKSMPDIEFNLDSALGETKINSSRITLFLIKRFKAAIRETMVLPNCESLCIPFMLAEKNDWVPRKSAPFIWLNQESSSSSNIDHSKEFVEGGLLSEDEPASPRAEILKGKSKSMQEGSAQSPNLTSLLRSSSETSNSSGEDDSKPKSRLGRKARMLDMKKRMGEKSKNIVEKMRGQ